MEQEKPDIFTCFVGNIPPRETITIKIRYVADLTNEGEKASFVLPTLVAPRYTPATHLQTSSSHSGTDGVPESSLRKVDGNQRTDLESNTDSLANALATLSMSRYRLPDDGDTICNYKFTVSCVYKYCCCYWLLQLVVA